MHTYAHKYTHTSHIYCYFQTHIHACIHTYIQNPTEVIFNGSHLIIYQSRVDEDLLTYDSLFTPRQPREGSSEAFTTSPAAIPRGDGDTDREESIRSPSLLEVTDIEQSSSSQRVWKRNAHPHSMYVRVHVCMQFIILNFLFLTCTLYYVIGIRTIISIGPELLNNRSTITECNFR